MNRLLPAKVIVICSLILFSPSIFASTNTNSYTGNKVSATEQVMSDTAITAKIKGLFVSEKVFGDKDISISGVKVTTKNGIVHLKGVVETETQADNAIKIAKSVQGVKKVIFKLNVRPVSEI